MKLTPIFAIMNHQTIIIKVKAMGKCVKPKAGQFWRHPSGEVRRVKSVNKFSVVWDETPTTIFIKYLCKHWKFIPRTPLEWLAVNELEWLEDKPLIGLIDGNPRYHRVFTDLPVNDYWYTKKEWQVMRINLGLDDKIKIDLTKNDRAKVV